MEITRSEPESAGDTGKSAGKANLLWLSMLRIDGLVILVAGAILLFGGARLAAIGGSPYYLLFGIAAAVSGALLILRRREGALLYSGAFLVTVAWAVWEAGYDGWALVPRVVAPAIAGLVLLVPGVRRMLRGRHMPLARGPSIALVAALLAAGPLLRAIVPPPISADPLYQTGMITASAPGDVAAWMVPADWAHYGSNLAATRFSGASQITTQNVTELEPAWSVHFGVMRGGMEATPIKVGNMLYVCTSNSDVVAVDATTGRRIWRFEARLGAADIKALAAPACRGVSYYQVPGRSGHCAQRILTTTQDARLVALDTKDGRACQGFGSNGAVSLMDGMGKFPHGYYHPTSAPTIAQGKIIVGGFVADGQSINEPSGVIRAFDAGTGKLVWAWDAGNPSRTGEPPQGQTYTLGTPNAWAAMSADETLGMVYVPLGIPAPDFFGAHRRPFDEAYDTALVVLDLATGRPRWSFQAIHHDLWDHDLAAQATLVDYMTLQGMVHAAILPTKRGDLFVLDRATGKPLRPVKEVPVPQAGAVREERLSPTQPESVGMPSFRGASLHESDMWGISPFDQLWCRLKFRSARYEGPDTPPGLTPAIEYPGVAGGINWGGVAYDPSRDIIIVNSMTLPHHIQLLTRAHAKKLGMRAFNDNDDSETILKAFDRAAQDGLPYAAITDFFLSPVGAPCAKPPYGHLSAVDMKTGKLIWTRSLGTSQDSGPWGIRSRLPIPMGTPNLGGSAVTRTGLTFIGATQDKYLRAFDTATGKELWKARLPSSAQATPMTYISPVDGRQYVVIAAGGHAVFPEPTDVYLMAFALPKK